MDDEPKRQPCPFCGSHDTFVLDAHTAVGQIFFICCQPCGACGPDTHTACNAAELWNARASSPLPRGGDRGGGS